MRIKRFHTEIHNIITIYIRNRYINIKIITCIILGLVISNVFACKTNSVFSDFVNSCVTGKHNRTGACIFVKYIFHSYEDQTLLKEISLQNTLALLGIEPGYLLYSKRELYQRATLLHKLCWCVDLILVWGTITCWYGLWEDPNIFFRAILNCIFLLCTQQNSS